MNGADVAWRIIRSLTDFWTGRSVALLLPGLDGGARGVIEDLERHGATVSVVVTATRPAADAPRVPHVWDCSAHGGPLSRRQFERWVHDPGPEVAAWLDDVDPARELVVLGNQYASITAFCGRTAHGRRRPEWGQWEDKVRVERLWRATGVASPDHVVGPPGDSALRAAAAHLFGEWGVVVARDSSRGFWGGSRGLTWVRHPADLNTCLDGLRDLADRVRIAGFVPGVPCSVIGLVLRDGVAVFDPIEIVTLCDPERSELLFCGTSTWWRPDDGIARDIREAARRAGERLAAVVGFRGMFSVDGIVSGGRFLATELNPRLSGGLGLAEAWPELSENLLHRGAQEALPGVHDADPQLIEEAVRSAIRRVPSLDVVVPLPGGDVVELPHVRPRAGDGLVAPAVVAAVTARTLVSAAVEPVPPAVC
ncbi:hypothetical protein [Saccharothrix variisporea]|uniref:ATP-grasp domain-containing protein n=1 Tax=Saccharothrix variisporea TaxID=543527 RepID=A0A495X6L3_9PSEU|nr:hypothetical protein [Saccharothrix variisporea]RKT69186.1 hypothetical protein DFJ66_2382 [Saccharothrix variisporea]